MLNPDILSDTLDRLDVKPEIDLFASRLNHQFPRYVFYKPGPLCRSCECIHNVMVWYDILFFPSLLYNPSILNKIIKDRARGILVVPDWPSQPWYPILARGLTQRPVLVSARENLLSCQQIQKQNTDFERHHVRLYAKYQEETKKLCFFSDS